MQIQWSGAALDPSGYGAATRGYLLALDKHSDHMVRLVSRQFWRGEVPYFGDDLSVFDRMAHTRLDLDQPIVAIQHLTPENYQIVPGVDYHIGVTTFETDDLPSRWQLNMRAMDELWTFSEWGAQVFRDKGIRRPVHVIPHGVETERFRPDVQPLRELQDLRKDGLFVFGSNLEWSPRKNPEGLVGAYLTHFSTKDPVVLVIKAYHQYPIERSVQSIKATIKKYKNAIGRPSDEYPRIQLVTNILAEDQLPGFYTGLDAYVLPSCGEGWGLTYTEAMSSGLPTIGVNWSGNTAFMNDQNSLLVKSFVMVEIEGRDVPPQYHGHKWAKCDLNELGMKMRQLFDGRSSKAFRDLGDRARQDMVNKWTWRHAAEAISERLQNIQIV